MFYIFSNILPINYRKSRPCPPTGGGHWRLNAIKFLIILPFTNYRSKHPVDNRTFNKTLADRAQPDRPKDNFLASV